jgi:uncharacterized protein YjbI with pentapeptide repeats|tara:strand:- start:278820 stop:279443 length:624 start_codon:yes stop_codon:yes gene_type:complete
MNKTKPPEIIRIKDRAGSILYQCEAVTIKQALSCAISAGVTIENVDLSYMDLSFADFDDGVFFNVSFKGANLTGANLSETSIQGCDFTESSLVAACLAYACVNVSQFLFADFAATDFTCATLLRCDFSGPSVFNIDFSNVDALVQACLYDDMHKDYMHLCGDQLRFAAGKCKYIVNQDNMYVNGCIQRTENSFIGYIHRELGMREAA